MTHKEWKARIEQEAASYSDPEAEWDATLSGLIEVRRLTAQMLGVGLKQFFDNYPFEEAVDLSIRLYQWMVEARTQECLSVVRSRQNGEDESGVIAYYEQEIEFFRERIRELEDARND